MLNPPLQRARSLVLFVITAVAVAGCASFATPKANVSVSDVGDAFPTIERLSAVVYMLEADGDGEPNCEYFEYGRGAFTSKPADEFCRVFDFDERHPGGGDEGPVPVAFDDKAQADLADLKQAFAGAGAPLDYMNLVLAADGSVGPDSGFAFDRCVAYWYQPGWDALPEDDPGESISSGINEDWYETDSCP